MVFDVGGSKSSGMARGAADFLATANPAGLIVSTGMKVYGEKSGSSKVEGRAEQTAKEIAHHLRKRFDDFFRGLNNFGPEDEELI